MTLLADLEAFVRDHRPHGELTGDATEPAWNGYLLTVACPCGVVFGRWVTPEDAEMDLLRPPPVELNSEAGLFTAYAMKSAPIASQ